MRLRVEIVFLFSKDSVAILITVTGKHESDRCGWFIVPKSTYDKWWDEENKYYFSPTHLFNNKTVIGWIETSDGRVRVVENQVVIKELFKEFGVFFGV